MASAQSPEQVILRVAALLGNAGIPYMLTGSFASGFYGAARASQDIDIVISPTTESLRRFLQSLPKDEYYVSETAALDAYERKAMFNIVDRTSGWKIDLIVRRSRPFSLIEFDRKAPAELSGSSVDIASAEDVLISKLEWARLSGSERQIEDVAGIIRIRGDQLDVTYVEYWVHELGLSQQWSSAKERAG